MIAAPTNLSTPTCTPPESWSSMAHAGLGKPLLRNFLAQTSLKYKLDSGDNRIVAEYIRWGSKISGLQRQLSAF